ncbi:Rieske (2Fe-2S) protein [Bradyrhizobium sp. STM 3562]|uniref:Rieske (2Fe-2S) protein n=1 Tax=Bradyrhizobium sp. STM 3562 TaxID=578924 RepID=UPI00388E20AE
MKGESIGDNHEIEVFIVCPADAIERGDARAFSLSRIENDGANRPFPIVVGRTAGNHFYGYVNRCPHDGVWLNIGSGEFFTPNRSFIKCGRHGAMFELESGLCISGPCNGKALEPLAVAVIGSDVCVCGVKLVEDDQLADLFDAADETMDIMIHPD